MQLGEYLNISSVIDIENKLVSEKQLNNYEIKLEMANHKSIYVLVSAILINQNHSSFGYIFLHDITERKYNLLALEKSKKRYNLLLNGINETIWLTTESGIIADFNDNTSIKLGYSRNELIGKHISIVDMNYQNLNFKEFDQLHDKNGYIQFETIHKTKSGKLIPVEISSKYMNLDGTKISLSIARDITERKLSEKKIKDAKMLLESSIEGVNNILIVCVDLDYRVIYSNNAFRQHINRVFEIEHTQWL